MNHQPLHLVQAVLSSRAFSAWAFRRGLGLDMGYAAHGLLRDVFGVHAPHPFRVEDKGREVHVLGYSGSDEAARSEHSSISAPPEAAQCVVSTFSRPVPANFPDTMRFRASVSAMVRSNRNGARKECDTFLLSLDGGLGKTREEVYAGHFLSLVPPGIKVNDVSVEKVLTGRRTVLLPRPDGQGRRPASILVPEYEVTGTLSREAGEEDYAQAVRSLLGRGIGRQRFLGLGAVFLSR